MPGTLTVNTLNDSSDASGSCTSSGTCSLRDAINQANSDNNGDTIVCSVTGTITLGSSTPGLSANVTIQGPGASQLTIDGGNGGVNEAYGNKVFFVKSGNASISGLTITDSGTGIQGGSVTYTGVTFTGITRNGSAAAHGAAIHAAPRKA